MRIGELSRRSGVPAPTIKYYVREGLLPAGDRTKANQAEYDEAHLRRLGLVCALIDVGGLSVRDAQRVIGHLDTPDVAPLIGMGKAQYALTPESAPPDDEVTTLARREAGALIERQGWAVGPNNPARESLAEALAALHRLGRPDLMELLDDYAAAAGKLAGADLTAVLRADSLDEIAETVVIWTVLGDRVFSALRRLAQENEAARRTLPPNETSR
jgi:DNA-binding transcriptional MerR regulator